jgi:hypothetical protein
MTGGPNDPGGGRSQSYSAPASSSPQRVVIPPPEPTGLPAIPDPPSHPVPAPMPPGPPARRDDGRPPRPRQGPGGPGGPGKGKSGQSRAKQGQGQGKGQGKSAKSGKKAPPKAASRSGAGGPSSGRRPAQNAHPAVNWNRLAPVYDIDGPRVRLGVLWFLVAFPAVVASPATTGLLYGAAAGMAARQIVQAWRSTPQWQADVAAGLAGVTVLSAVGGSSTLVLVLVVAVIAALIAGFNGSTAGLRGSSAHMAAAGVMVAAIVPVSIAGAAMVLVRAESATAAGIVILFASAYEVGDFLVGSGGSTPIEGPLAGGAALIVTGFPMALLLVEPFDVLGVAMLGVAALCCPVGQWIASAVLPKPDALAPALRRIDTLLLLAPVWVVANAAF